MNGHDYFIGKLICALVLALIVLIPAGWQWAGEEILKDEEKLKGRK